MVEHLQLIPTLTYDSTRLNSPLQRFPFLASNGILWGTTHFSNTHISSMIT